MGQAWCKEKTSKAQDSKSPLDRVFVRCAHRIYPSLKEEGSVLGGATQRVTSSEIGYAGSPPREVLARGRSIDSVDRPFHPSDWVDVNLEVPSTPRASSVLTNLTVDTSLYPATTPTSSCSNLKDVTPVPPPRRKKRNRGRPLPPKPDEVHQNVSNNLRHIDSSDEPLYSSVKSPRPNDDEQDVENDEKDVRRSRTFDDAKHEGKKTKDIYKHKVNGTGRIISSDVVSGKRSADKRTSRISDAGYQKRSQESEDYDRFANGPSIKDTSTPNQKTQNKSVQRSKDSGQIDSKEVNTRTKNYSTVSLPNYDELDVRRHQARRNAEEGEEERKTRRPVRSSTGSLPADSFLSPFSQKTSVRFEDYMPRRGSLDNLLPYQVLGKLGCSENGVDDSGFVKYDPSKLEDWNLGDISNCESNQRRGSFEEPTPGGTEKPSAGEDVVDSAQDEKTEEDKLILKDSSRINDRGGSGAFVVLQKPDVFGKTAVTDLSKESDDLDDWIARQSRSLKYFDSPTRDMCKSPACESSTEEFTSPTTRREPFFLNEENRRLNLDTIGGSGRNGDVQESDRSRSSRMILGRSLSNESEPHEDSYETKELRVHPTVTGKLIRTISEESLPREMLEEVDEEPEDFFDEKLAKDVCNKMKKQGAEEKTTGKTPPPSPEPKIKAQIQDNDHSILLKVLKDEAADESNLSSMTPSLTELEAALSDMLEKEEQQEQVSKRHEDEGGIEATKEPTPGSPEKLIEPRIVPVDKTSGFREDTTDVLRRDFAGKILVDEDSENPDELPRVAGGLEEKSLLKGRKVSFCAWEETRMMEANSRDAQDRKISKIDSDASEGTPDKRLEDVPVSSNTGPEAASDDSSGTLLDEAPEKPSRLHRSNLEDSGSAPTPPRRKHRSSMGVSRDNQRTTQNGADTSDPFSNDRLI